MKDESYLAIFVGGPADGTQRRGGCSCCEGVQTKLIHHDHVLKRATGTYNLKRWGDPVELDGETLRIAEYEWRELADGEDPLS